MNIYHSYKHELLNSIPVVAGMDIDIINIEPNSISLTAPLNTNINYEGTAFGGSLNTLCVLSAYLLVHHTLMDNNIEFSSLVIQDSAIQYLSPVEENFTAKATVSEKSKKLLIRSLNKSGVGRMAVESVVTTSGSNDPKVMFNGRYVVSR